EDDGRDARGEGRIVGVTDADAGNVGETIFHGPIPAVSWSMIRKSMPSGYDPTGGYRFSERDHAQTINQPCNRARQGYISRNDGFNRRARRGSSWRVRPCDKAWPAAARRGRAGRDG